jgi:hypothetical protein
MDAAFAYRVVIAADKDRNGLTHHPGVRARLLGSLRLKEVEAAA